MLGIKIIVCGFHKCFCRVARDQMRSATISLQGLYSREREKRTGFHQERSENVRMYNEILVSLKRACE